MCRAQDVEFVGGSCRGELCPRVRTRAVVWGVGRDTPAPGGCHAGAACRFQKLLLMQFFKIFILTLLYFTRTYSVNGNSAGP